MLGKSPPFGSVSLPKAIDASMKSIPTFSCSVRRDSRSAARAEAGRVGSLKGNGGGGAAAATEVAGRGDYDEQRALRAAQRELAQRDHSSDDACRF